MALSAFRFFCRGLRRRGVLLCFRFRFFSPSCPRAAFSGQGRRKNFARVLSLSSTEFLTPRGGFSSVCLRRGVCSPWPRAAFEPSCLAKNSREFCPSGTPEFAPLVGGFSQSTAGRPLRRSGRGSLSRYNAWKKSREFCPCWTPDFRPALRGAFAPLVWARARRSRRRRLSRPSAFFERKERRLCSIGPPAIWG